MQENSTRITRVGFLLVDGFSMLCLTAMINSFRSANRLLSREVYKWDFITPTDEAVTASDGLQAPATLPVSTNQSFAYFFVCAGLNTNPGHKSKINAAMQRFSRNSSVFGALCTGSFLLARAGFLNGYSFTLHWENLPAFHEEFPDLVASSNLYVIDRDRWTGSGGLSSMDMALNIIERDHGKALVHAVGNQFQIDRVRSANVDQRPYDMQEYENLPKALQSAVQLMQANMEIPFAVPDIASHVGTTVRSLERMFNRHLQFAPATFYRRLRLEKARQLLWHTNISILEIAFMTGFSSPSYLSRMYQAQYGKMPSQERKQSA